MRFADVTLPTPEENLAYDQRLLELAESGVEGEVLRVWEPRSHFVVLGYSRNPAEDVDQAACARLRMPILRRCSGGGTIVQGPGVLNFSLILDLHRRPACRTIRSATAYVLERHRQTLEALLGRPISIQGISDLTVDSQKFSGNAQRRLRRFTLIHGTFLINLDLDLMDTVLRIPADQPSYRHGRIHREFLINLHEDTRRIKDALRRAWDATIGLS